MGLRGDLNGRSHSLSRMVESSMTASAVGSGGVDVLSTPTMILLMEMAARDAVAEELEDGEVTVGVHVDVKHLAATPVGDRVTVAATVTSVADGRIEFLVEARDSRRLIGRGNHTRAVVDLQRFISSLEKPLDRADRI